MSARNITNAANCRNSQKSGENDDLLRLYVRDSLIGQFSGDIVGFGIRFSSSLNPTYE